MKKIAIVTDEAHLKRMVEFTDRLMERAEVELILAERTLADFEKREIKTDAVLVRTRDPVTLALLSSFEANGAPIINPPRAIFFTHHRFLLNSVLFGADIPQPDFSVSRAPSRPFDHALLKNHSGNMKRNKDIHVHLGKGRAEDVSKRACCYYQEYIEPEAEYKIYGIGDELVIYRQKIPVIFNARYRQDKKRYLELVEAPEVEALAGRGLSALGLKMSSMDVIRSKEGELYIVDVNTCPSLKKEVIIDKAMDYILGVR